AAALLRFGQERIDLAGDIEGARLAFRQAAERLEAIDDTRLNRARRLVAGELEALTTLKRPDWTGIGGRLSALAEGSSGWPSRPAGESRSGQPGDPDGKQADEGWWAALKGGMRELVRVREREAVPVTDEAVDRVREQLRLRLLAAELSAVRRDAGELSRHAAATGRMVERWFDVDDEAVAGALATLEEIAAIDPPTPPRLGEGLEEVHSLLAES
ncbi:MAG: uroporphyrinogen-III C-methyltransferase, partial [Wenzhouxiangella sp.]